MFQPNKTFLGNFGFSFFQIRYFSCFSLLNLKPNFKHYSNNCSKSKLKSKIFLSIQEDKGPLKKDKRLFKPRKFLEIKQHNSKGFTKQVALFIQSDDIDSQRLLHDHRYKTKHIKELITSPILRFSIPYISLQPDVDCEV